MNIFNSNSNCIDEKRSDLNNYECLDEKCMIKIHGLKKHFISKNMLFTALNDINLQINKGDIYGIIGLSGAGKSTLIRCINRLDTPSDGDIIIDNINVSCLTGKELCKIQRSVGMVFQYFNLLMQRTVLENIMFPLELIKASKKESITRATELIRLVGLSDKAKSYPCELSGGQKQRVALARALILNPKVLLCDEATSALDPITTYSILSLLEKINHELGITIVIITHQMEVIRQICTHVAIMDKGKIVEKGTVSEVFTQPKNEATKNLLSQNVHGLDFDSKSYINIRFQGNAAQVSMISTLFSKVKTPINIVSGNIYRLNEKSYGQLIIEYPNDINSKNMLLSYLNSSGLIYEEVNNNGNDLV